MRIAILNDTHAGVRNNSTYFMDRQEDFYSKLFWPVIDKLKIGHVLHLGDYFDSVKSVNVLALHRNKQMFIDPARDRNMEIHFIPGNHDVYHKHTNEVCSMDIILGNYPNFHVHMKPVQMNFGSSRVHMIPWITPENQTACIEQISKASPDHWTFGHFEIAGYKMYRNSSECKLGMDRSIFPNLDRTRSGHFHEPNGIYLGAPMEFTWSDCGCDRGFSILDTETGKLTFIRNPMQIFHEIVYDPELDVTKADLSHLSNKIVRIVAMDVADKAHFDAFHRAVTDVGPHELDIVIKRPVKTSDRPVEALSVHETSLDLLRARMGTQANEKMQSELDIILTELEPLCT